MNTKPLSELKVGEKAQIISFDDDNPQSQRIEEMGVTPGETVEIVRFAPMGDPIEIKIRGYLLTIRQKEAQSIQVSI